VMDDTPAIHVLHDRSRILRHMEAGTAPEHSK